MAQLNLPSEEKTDFPYYVHEIMENLEDFQVGERQARGQYDSFVPVTYKGKRCKIQTPVVVIMFGLSDYDIPGEPNKKVCLHISLKDTDKEVKDFADFLYLLDDFAKEYQLSDKHKYCSSIREYYKNPQLKSPVVRLKINITKNGRLILDIIDSNGKILSLPTIEEFKALITHHTQAKVIFEVNPIWYAGNKYGISYRLLQILIVAEARRPLTFRP